jgi:hypothetical protein
MDSDIKSLIEFAANIAFDAAGGVYQGEGEFEYSLGMGMSIVVAPKVDDSGCCLEEMTIYFVGGMGRFRHEVPVEKSKAIEFARMMVRYWPDFDKGLGIYNQVYG